MSALSTRLFEPAATARWKRTSWRRNSWGASIETYMPVISSDIAASWSPVARSAASATELTSSTRRASKRSSRVMP